LKKNSKSASFSNNNFNRAVWSGTTMDIPPVDTILTLGLLQVGFTQRRLDRTVEKTKQDRFVAAFGVSPLTVHALLHDLATTAVVAARIHNPKLLHLSMALYWLKNNMTHSTMAGIFDCDEKTVRKYVWLYVTAIQAMKQEKIIWPWDTNPTDTIIMLSVDGVHCRIQEPRQFPDGRWYSHKFHKAALAYELGISMEESRLVWIKGPYKAATHDVTILRRPNGLKEKMETNHPGKRILADRGYSGEPALCAMRNRFDTVEVRDFKRRGRARHESFNGRIKWFRVLSEVFPVNIRKHKPVFEACCVLMQYEMENGKPLFTI
jgi:hypothetical protein